MNELPLFKNEKIENELLKKGYVKFNLLDENELNTLTSFFENPLQNKYKNTFTTFATNDKKYKEQVSNCILETVGQKLLPYINKSYTPFWGNFMVKAPKSENMQLHADWSYVDENKHRSFNCWTPLQDTDLKNGTLWVVPKSHFVVKGLRGINFPREYYRYEQELISNYAIPLNFKAGEVIIYDHRLLHLSLPNLTSIARVALSMIISPTDAPIYYHFFNYELNRIDSYLVKNNEFYFDLVFASKPNNTPIDFYTAAENITPINMEDINKHLDKKNFLSKIKHRFIISNALKTTENK